MNGFVDRENKIFEVLQRFNSEDLDYVVIGGYAVSAYRHRFSVDADLVIRSENLEQFVEVLEEKSFEKEADRDLVYSGRYVAYVKDEELPVTIDLLVDELQCRQTDASWSIQYFENHSVEKEVEGSEKSFKARVPTRELLIAVKLHSGRLTDTRDVVALINNADPEEIKKHIDRGDREKLRQVMKNIELTVSDSDFEDSFKGVFSTQNLPGEQIQKLQKLIQELG